MAPSNRSRTTNSTGSGEPRSGGLTPMLSPAWKTMKARRQHKRDRSEAQSRPHPTGVIEQTSPFFKLPPEMRHEIYRHLFKLPSATLYFNPEKQRFSTTPDSYVAPVFPLTFVCTEIARDTFFLPLQLNRLCFGKGELPLEEWNDKTEDDGPVSQLLQFWTRIDALQVRIGLIAGIRRITLRVRLDVDGKGNLYCYFRPWNTLLRDLSSVTSQPSCTLEIVVEFGSHPEKPYPVGRHDRWRAVIAYRDFMKWMERREECEVVPPKAAMRELENVKLRIVDLRAFRYAIPWANVKPTMDSKAALQVLKEALVENVKVLRG